MYSSTRVSFIDWENFCSMKSCWSLSVSFLPVVLAHRHVEELTDRDMLRLCDEPSVTFQVGKVQVKTNLSYTAKICPGILYVGATSDIITMIHVSVSLVSETGWGATSRLWLHQLTLASFARFARYDSSSLGSHSTHH